MVGEREDFHPHASPMRSSHGFSLALGIHPPIHPSIHSSMGEKKSIRVDSVTPRIGERGGGVLHMRNGTPFRCTCASSFFPFLPLSFPSCCFPAAFLLFALLLSCCFACVGLCVTCFSHTFYISCLLPTNGRNAGVLRDRSMEGRGLGSINQSIDERRICSVRFIA